MPASRGRFLCCVVIITDDFLMFLPFSKAGKKHQLMEPAFGLVGYRIAEDSEERFVKSVLVALNAQYIHTSLSVRSIAAYFDAQGAVPPLIAEFTINQHAHRILQLLHQHRADIYLFSCYIWNVEIIRHLANDLHRILPEAVLVAGGPQVGCQSEEFLRQNPAFSAVVSGEGEESCLRLVQALEGGGNLSSCPGLVFRDLQADTFVYTPPPKPLSMDSLPFAYTDMDILDGRIFYYESMRGCPFACSYCLSSAEQGVRFKSLPLVFDELQRLLGGSPRQVKFVDRTFNCSKAHAMGIWLFLAQNDNGRTNFHFELAGEFLDDEMISFLAGVRPGLFQFEIGVQSVNPATLKEIQRFENLEKLFANVSALRDAENVHLHLDLIAGLPYEDFDSFVNSFNMVYAQHPHQLQLGFLKVLPGSGMRQNAKQYGLECQSLPPYEVLRTRWLSFEELCILKQVAHMAELYYNSGRFSHTICYLCGQFATPFSFYRALAEAYDTRGHEDAPLGKMGYYALLGATAQTFGDAVENRAQWLCKYDLALHEKIKTLPPWVQADETSALRGEILDFYSDDENVSAYLPAYSGLPPKQIRKMAHLEIFPFHPETGEEGRCALLFDYQRRDLTGKAAVQEVTVHFFSDD